MVTTDIHGYWCDDFRQVLNDERDPIIIDDARIDLEIEPLRAFLIALEMRSPNAMYYAKWLVDYRSRGLFCEIRALGDSLKGTRDNLQTAEIQLRVLNKSEDWDSK